MAQDPAAIDSRADPAAEKLKAIRDRVAGLQRRIKTARDPKALAQFRAEVGKLTELIGELVQAAGGGSGEIAKAGAIAWPRDLNGASTTSAEWGADPAEVAGG